MDECYRMNGQDSSVFVKIKQLGAVTASCRLVCQVFEVLETYAFTMGFQPNENECSGDA